MKNKFKKSKIIVPALALITTTTVASVTGTVAWFSANRQATVTANFQATDAEGALEVSTTSGVGTTGTSTYATTSAVTVDGVLTHGSYNATADYSGILYVANVTEGTSGYEINSYEDHGTIADSTGDTITAANLKWLAGQKSDNTKIWYAVSWTVNIRLKADNNASANKMVFVDFSKTTFASNVDVNQGFRVALMDGIHTYVIGNDGQKNHVIGTSTTNVGTWTNEYHQFGETYTAVKDNDSKAASEVEAKGFLFELTGTTAKTVTCVAWYEGEDTNVVSNTANTFDVSGLTLDFYSRSTVTA